MILLASYLLFFCSCKKESEADSSNVTKASSTDEILETDSPGISATTLGYTKFVLQPGDDGQDAWIDWYEGDPSYADGNSGSIDQFKCLAWTIGGVPVYSRTLIRFDGLSVIPDGSSVLYAKLFLFGLSSSPIHLPEGNSYYPGSPYNIYGPNGVNVQRIISPWDEGTVTWNTQPSSTTDDQSKIQASNAQWNYNASADVTKMVRYFLANPSANYGFLLSLINETPYHSMGFCSSEYKNAGKDLSWLSFINNFVII